MIKSKVWINHRIIAVDGEIPERRPKWGGESRKGDKKNSIC